MRNKELEDLMFHCSSVKSEYTVAGKKVYVFKERCVLNPITRKPVELSVFLRINGEREFITNEPRVRKSDVEKRNLKAAKRDYVHNMERFLGKNWKKLSETHRIYNVPSDSQLRIAIRKELGV
jgi:hypothetical protein